MDDRQAEYRAAQDQTANVQSECIRLTARNFTESMPERLRKGVVVVGLGGVVIFGLLMPADIVHNKGSHGAVQ